MADPVYVSEVRIERIEGPVRRAFLPGNAGPTMYSVHGAIAEHYKVPPDQYEVHATTIDHVVAATGG